MRTLKLTALALVASVLPAVDKGPDAASYIATDNTVYSFVDLTGGGGAANVLAGTDDAVALMTLPFSFAYYGHNYTLICASSNGMLTFVSTPDACATTVDFANTDLTSTATPGNTPAVLPFWSDLTFQVAGGGALYYQSQGAPGNRRLVIEWSNAYPQGSANPVTFEVILHEGTNQILFQYQTVDLGPGNTATKGALATVGIRDAGGNTNNRQIQWSYRAAVLNNSSAILFTPPTGTQTSVNTIDSVPQGLTVTIDGVPYATPKIVSWIPGTNHTLSVVTPITNGGARFALTGWSPGGGATSEISVQAQASGITYTANFSTQYLLTTTTNPPGLGTFSGTAWQNAGQQVPVQAAEPQGYVFSYFSGDLAGHTNPQNVTMNGPKTVVANFSSSDGLRFVPMTPCRIADTRKPAGPFGGPQIDGGGTRAFLVPQSSCGIPATAQAYALNVAVVPVATLGYLTVWPAGQNKPLASTLNSLDGRIKSNAAVVPAGTDGGINVFASNATNIILDITGYFVRSTEPAALAFYPIAPCRITDTRKAAAPLGGPSLTGGQPRSFPVLSASACNIPATAQAYSLNFAAVPKGRLGYLTAWPTGQSRPTVASLNAVTGTVTANAAIVPAGDGGAIDIFASDNTDLVIDINGYFAPITNGGLSLYNLTPCRLMDTRQPPGSPPVSGAHDIGVAQAACSAPAASQAVVLSATVVPSGSLGYLTLWPQGQGQPTVSTLNALDGVITSNLALVPTANAGISYFPSNAAHLVLDLFGYFAQ